MARLKTQCDHLKTERQTLIADCAQRASSRDDLQKAVDNLRAEGDSLRIYYRQEFDKNNAWQNDMASLDYDSHGKLNRRLWLEQERNAGLLKELEASRKAHEDDVQVEYATAAGLRDRIGKLEEKVRKGKLNLAEGGAQERISKLEVEAERTRHESKAKHLRTEWMDMKEALGKEKKEVGRLTAEVATLTEKTTAQDEFRRLRDESVAR